MTAVDDLELLDPDGQPVRFADVASGGSGGERRWLVIQVLRYYG